jgi:hypothetical protein
MYGGLDSLQIGRIKALDSNYAADLLADELSDWDDADDRREIDDNED